MGSAARKLETMTLEEYEALPEEDRVEIINGFVYAMSSPTVRHQRISMKLSTDIYRYIDSKKGHCEVFSAPFDVKLKDKPLTIVQPDIVIVCDPKKTENGKRCEGAPDWVIEIVSPSSREHDYLTKLSLYKEAAVREFWIVDPDQEQVITYMLEEERFEVKIYHFGDEILVGIYEDLKVVIE